MTLGYSAAFLTLAVIALAGFLLYLAAMPETRNLALRNLAPGGASAPTGR